jgi:hypothetical protein
MHEYPEIESRMEKAHAWWQDKDIGLADFYEALTPTTRKAVAVGHFNYQVHNGGFSQWHDNRYAACGASTVKALCRELNTKTSEKVASLITAALLAVEANERIANDDEDRMDFIEDTSPYDDAYYAISEQFLAEVEAWLAKNSNTGAP